MSKKVKLTKAQKAIIQDLQNGEKCYMYAYHFSDLIVLNGLDLIVSDDNQMLVLTEDGKNLEI